MATCIEKHHANHTHKHGPSCGHTAIRHDVHVDYLHDGHLHHMHEDHVDEHVIAVNSTIPRSARLTCTAHTVTVQTADMNRCRMATILTILWTAGGTIRTVVIR